MGEVDGGFGGQVEAALGAPLVQQAGPARRHLAGVQVGAYADGAVDDVEMRRVGVGGQDRHPWAAGVHGAEEVRCVEVSQRHAVVGEVAEVRCGSLRVCSLGSASKPSRMYC